MQITPIPCLTDNYAYIISDNNSKIVGVVDPSESSPIISFLNKKNLKLSYILNTHHHFDHIGGNTELKKLYNAKVVGFVGDKHRIPGIDITLKDNEAWSFGNSPVKILHIPGHTSGHICFFFEKEAMVFTGDTLFSLGCGRIFEGDHKQMLNSLNRIKKLRAKNLPTLPTTLADELNSNIFLRCDQKDLKIKLNMMNREDLEVFKKIRDLKDTF